MASAAGEVDEQVADLVAGQRDQCVRDGVVGSFGRGHGEEGVRGASAGARTDRGMIGCMDVLSSRILLRPVDLDRSRRFYRDTLGLAVYREFGDRDDPGLVFFLGGGHLEVSGVGDGTTAHNLALWIQVRDLAAEQRRLQVAGVEIVRAPEREPWGLLEMWIVDPDGLHIVLVEVPAQHPLRRDNR